MNNNNFNNKTTKIIIIISIIGIISIIIGTTVFKSLVFKKTNNVQENSKEYIEKLFKLLKDTDFKIEKDYIQSIKKFKYNDKFGPYNIIFKNINNSIFNVYINDKTNSKIGEGKINEKQIKINFDDSFIIEGDLETKKIFFLNIKNWIKNKKIFDSNFSKVDSIKNNVKISAYFSSLLKQYIGKLSNEKHTKAIKDIKIVSDLITELKNLIKDIKKYNITFNEINKKTKSKDLSIDLFNEFDLEGRWISENKIFTIEKILYVKKFLEELKEIKIEVQELVNFKKRYINIETIEMILNKTYIKNMIILLINNKNFKIVLSKKIDNFLLVSEYFDYIKITKKLILKLEVKNNIKKFKLIKNFLNCINNLNKEWIINKNKKEFERQIKSILLDLSVNKILFYFKKNKILLNKLIKKTKYLNNEIGSFIFKNINEIKKIFFSIENKTQEKLQSILDFLNYINDNKIKIKQQLNEEKILNRSKKTKLVLEINEKLIDEIKQILNNLNKGILLKNELPISLNDSLDKDLFKEFNFDNSNVSFEMEERTEKKLQSILEFLIYIGNNKIKILEKLELAKLFKKRQNIETQIKNLLTNEIKKILNSLNKHYLLFDDLLIPLNILIEKELYKEFVFSSDSEITFEMGEKTEEELQSILDFLNYINNNKIKIKKQLDDEQNKKLVLDINTKLNNEIQQIILRLSTRINGILELPELPTNINFNKDDFVFFNSKIILKVGKKKFKKLQSILDFLNYINNNKTNIKTYLDNEQKNKLVLNINEKLTNEVQQIILRLITRTNGILELPELPTNISFNKDDFVFVNSKVSFKLGKKTHKKLQSILDFLNYVNDNKTNIKEQLDDEQKNKWTSDIYTNLNDKIIQQIVLRLSTRTNGILGLLNKPENISFNKEDFSIDGSIVTFVTGDKTKEELQSILDFLNYINDNKINIKEQLDDEQKNKWTSDIYTNLNDKIIQKIVLRLSTRTNGILGLLNKPENISFNKEDFVFVNSKVSFKLGKKTHKKLQSILDFLNYVNDNKTNIKEQLDDEQKNKWTSDIYTNLNDKIIQQIVLRLSTRTNGILGLLNKPKNISFNKEDFIFVNSKVSFLKDNKTEQKLQSILDFLNFINNNKIKIKKQLDDEQKNKLVLDIKTKLNNEVQQIVLRLSTRTNGILGLLNKPKNISFNKEDFVFVNSKVSFKLGKKTHKKLQSILEFINYVNDNKTNIKEQLDDEQKNKWTSDIYTNLNNKIIQQIVLRLSTRTNGILGLLNKPENISFNKEDFIFVNSKVSFLKDNKTEQKLQSILDFLNFINNNKIKIKKQLDDEQKNKLVLDIKTKLNNEVQQIVLRLSTRINGILGLLNKPKNISFNKEDFIFVNSKVSFLKDNKTEQKLQSILEFINYVNDNKTNIKEQLDDEQKNKWTSDIYTNLNNKIIQQIVLRLSTRTNGILGLLNKPENISFNKEDFIFVNSKVSFLKDNKTEQKLQSILDFLNFINNNKIKIKKQLDDEQKNKLVLDIKTKLNNEVQQIVLRLSTRINGILGLLNKPKNISFNKEDFIFVNSKVSFLKDNKTEQKLQSILEFINYVNDNKTNIKEQLDDEQKNKWTSDIYTNLNNKIIQQIVLRLSTRTNGILGLLNKPENISFNKEDFIFINSKVFFEPGNKTQKKLQSILDFLNYINDNKINIKIQLDNEQKNKLVLDINTKLNNEIIQQIILRLSSRTNGIVGLPNKPENISFNKEDFIFVNSKVSFLKDNKSEQKLQSILDFLNYINDNKINIKIQLDNEQKNKLALDINTKLNNEIIQQIILRLSSRINGIVGLPNKPENISFNKEDFIFVNSKVSFLKDNKSEQKLQSILDFLNYVNDNKIDIQKQLDNEQKNKLIIDINTKLIFEIKQIILRLSTRTNGIVGLPNKSENISFNKEDFIFVNSKVSFKVGEKTILKLQSILEFINYINDNKLEIKTQLDGEKTNKLVLDINEKLTDEVKQIILRLKIRTGGIIGLPNKLLNIYFNKKDFIFINSKVFFEPGNKTQKKLQSILDFLNYINNNKIKIKKQLDDEQKNKLALDINTKLNNEVKQIISILRTRINGIVGLPELPTDISFNKDDFVFINLRIWFKIGNKKLEKLQSILDFLNYINNNKIKIKKQLNNEKINKLILEINTKLTNEIKQIILRLITRTNGIVGLPELSINISFNKEDFLINNSEISFEIGNKTEEKLQSILNFINYINDNVIKIKQQLNKELLNQRTQLTSEINTKLNNEVKRIVLRLSTRTNGIFGLTNKPDNISFNKDDFSIYSSRVTFLMGEKTKRKLQSILDFLNYIKDNKTNIKKQLNKELLNQRTQLTSDINIKLNNEVKRIILKLSTRTNGILGLTNKPRNISFNKDDFLINGSIVSFLMGERTKEKLQSILEFINYINDNKTNIKKQLDKELLNQRTKLELDINNKLTNEIKQIILRLSTRTNGIFGLTNKPDNISFNKDDFSIYSSRVTFLMGEKTKRKLQSILDFLNYIKDNKTNIKKQLDKELLNQRTKLELDINNKLTNEIKQIILRLSTRTNGILGLTNKPRNISFNKEDFLINGSIVSFSIGKKTKRKLQSILDFLNYIQNNKTNIKKQLDKELLKKRTQLELDINNKLTNEIKQIILRLSTRTNGILGLTNKPRNISFNKEDFLINGSIVSFSIGKKTKRKLQSILDFLNYIQNNKTNIKKQLDKELLKKRTQLELDINNKLTNEIKQIILRLSTRTNGIFGLTNKPDNISFNKDDFSIYSSRVTFLMDEKTKGKLQSILDFLNYIKDNKTNIKKQLDKELLKKRTQLTLEINAKLNNEVKRIILRLNTRTNGILGLTNKPRNISFNKDDFLINGSIVSFSMGKKIKEELQSILDFLNYINDNKTNIKKQLDKELLNQRTKLVSYINEKLTDEIKEIILILRTRTNGISGLPNKPRNIIFNKDDFSINGSIVSFLIYFKPKYKLQSILDFLNYINNNKIKIKKQLDKELLNQRTQLELDINNKLTNEIKQIILRLSTRTNGILGLTNKPRNISFNKEDFLINGSIVSFSMGKKTKRKLQSILDFLNYIQNNKTNIKKQLDKELLKKRTQLTLDINTKLNNEVKRIILRLSTRTNGIFGLTNKPRNISFNKEDFLINGSIVTFEMGEKTKRKLQSILDFINYINNNKINIKKQLDKELLNQRTQLILDINIKLTDEIQQIISRLRKRTNSISGLPNKPYNISFNKEDFLINGSIVSFLIRFKSKYKLQSILDFINYINNNKTNIKKQLDKELLNQRTKLELDINNKLTNEIKQIILRLSTRTNGILGLPNKPKNISFNKEDFLIQGSTVSFLIRFKSKYKLQSILDFLNYIKDNKTNIKKQLDKELLNQRTQLTSEINTKLNNEIKRIILRLSTRTKGILELPELPTNISFNKDDFLINDSTVLFEIGSKSKDKLQSILEFLNYVDHNKINIKKQLDKELLNQRTKLELDINNKLTDEIKQIILRLITRTNGISGLLNKPRNIIFNKYDFSINGSTASFSINFKPKYKLQSILDFLNYINNNKINIKKQLDKELLNKRIQLTLEINTKLNNEVKRIILRLSTRTKGILELPELPTNIRFNKDDFSIFGSIVLFEMDKKTKEELQSILEFLNYVDHNKINIKKQLDKELLNQRTKLELDINNKLTDEIKQIILRLNTRTNGILGLPNKPKNISFNKEDFLINGSIVSFLIRFKSKYKLQSILDFLNYINDNKTNIKKQLDKELLNKRTKLELNINDKLTNEIKQIILRLNTRTNGILRLTNKPRNISFNREDFLINDSEISFEMGEKSISKLQSILDFLNYINNNKTNIKKQLDKELLNKRTKLELDINDKLTNEIKQIILRLSIRINGILKLPNKPTNINFNKNDFLINDSTVLFEIGSKSKDKLQSILEFLNYVDHNKINIKKQLDKELLNQRTQLTLDINTKLNNKVKRIILRLSTRTNGISGLPNKPDNISFNKDDFKIIDSTVSFSMIRKTKEELQSILDFLNYINNNKIKIKKQLDKELLNKRTQLTLEINTKLNNEVKRIILRLITRTNGILKLPNKPKNIIFNKNDFLINGSIVSFLMGEKIKQKLQSILDFLNYINDNKTNIKKQLDKELLNQKIKLVLDINNNLTDEIKEIILRLSIRTNGILELPNKPRNIILNKEDFLIQDSTVSFLKDNKSEQKLQSILDFLNYINNNKINIINQLNFEDKNKLVLNINTKLNNEVQQIILRLITRTNGFLGLINKPRNIIFNKYDFSINGSTVLFKTDKKTKEELQSILDFLNYIDHNKKNIKKQLDKELLNQRTQLESNINTKLTTEVQQIILKLSTRTNGISGLPKKPENISFNKENFIFINSTVSFLKDNRTKEELQSILDFLNYINENKRKILEILEIKIFKKRKILKLKN